MSERVVGLFEYIFVRNKSIVVWHISWLLLYCSCLVDQLLLITSCFYRQSADQVILPCLRHAWWRERFHNERQLFAGAGTNTHTQYRPFLSVWLWEPGKGWAVDKLSWKVLARPSHFFIDLWRLAFLARMFPKGRLSCLHRLYFCMKYHFHVLLIMK